MVHPSPSYIRSLGLNSHNKHAIRWWLFSVWEGGPDLKGGITEKDVNGTSHPKLGATKYVLTKEGASLT